MLFLCDGKNSKDIPFTNDLMKSATDSIQTKLSKHSDGNSNESQEKDDLIDCVSNLLDNISTINDNDDMNGDDEMEADVEDPSSLFVDDNGSVGLHNTHSDDEDDTTTNNTLDTCHKWALVDIFEHGNTVLGQKNIISIRKKGN